MIMNQSKDALGQTLNKTIIDDETLKGMDMRKMTSRDSRLQLEKDNIGMIDYFRRSVR